MLYKEKYVMNITKRLLVLLITVSMLLSGSFVQAFAEEETVDSASVAVPETVSEEDSEDLNELMRLYAEMSLEQRKLLLQIAKEFRYPYEHPRITVVPKNVDVKFEYNK